MMWLLQEESGVIYLFFLRHAAQRFFCAAMMLARACADKWRRPLRGLPLVPPRVLKAWSMAASCLASKRRSSFKRSRIESVFIVRALYARLPSRECRSQFDSPRAFTRGPLPPPKLKGTDTCLNYALCRFYRSHFWDYSIQGQSSVSTKCIAAWMSW